MKTYVGALLAGMLTGLVLYLGFTLLSDEALPFLETPYYLVVLPLFLLFLYIPVFKEKIVHSGGKKPVVVFLTFAVFSIGFFGIFTALKLLITSLLSGAIG